MFFSVSLAIHLSLSRARSKIIYLPLSLSSHGQAIEIHPQEDKCRNTNCI